MLGNIRVKPANREVVKEEQRRRALNRYVVYAVIDEALADGIVAACSEGNLELRADAIRRTDQHGIAQLPAPQRVGRAERPNARQDVLVEGPLGQPANPISGTVRCVDVHASIDVGQGLVQHRFTLIIASGRYRLESGLLHSHLWARNRFCADDLRRQRPALATMLG